MTEVEVHERLARVEANHDGLLRWVTSISDKIDKQSITLDEIRMDLHQTKGATAGESRAFALGGHFVTGLLSAGAAVGTMMSGIFGRH